MAEIIKTKTGETLHRWETVIKDGAFDLIRDGLILETNADLLLRVLQEGTVSTNVYLRRLHNFALDMGWLPWPALPKRQWPKVRHQPKRAITLEEHQAGKAKITNEKKGTIRKGRKHPASEMEAQRLNDSESAPSGIEFSIPKESLILR